MQKVKPRTNGRDIIAHQQLQKMLDVTCCVRLHTLLHVVGSYCAKFEISILPPGGEGALGYFLGGYVPPGTPNWHPVLKKISPKIDTPF